MAYILDPISIATRGYVGPVPSSGDYCPAPIAIGTLGYVRFPFSGAMADPWHGKDRFKQPFDRGYFIWKYGKPQQSVEDAETESARVLAAEIAEVEAYIEEVNEGIISGLTAKVIAQEMNEQRQAETLVRLSENVAEAREALIMALERQLAKVRKRNVAAIEAAIRYYF